MDMLVCVGRLVRTLTQTERKRPPKCQPANAPTGRNDEKMTADSSFHGNLKQ